MAARALSLSLWISLFSIVQVSGQCLNDQISLLLQLNNSLNLQVNWDLNVDCCKWDGVGCDDGGMGHVISLELNERSISGDLENAGGLFRLQYLERLNLANNMFYNAHIPRGLANLTNLVYLNLSNAGFVGQVPIELSKMRSLVFLDISSRFEKEAGLKLENPDLKILVQNLAGLRELYLDWVSISSQGSDWCRSLSSSLPNLRILSMRGCNLSGPLHPSLSQLQYLSVLQLDENDLRTVVPDFFANFSSLTTLTLGFCSLLGTFPGAIFQMPKLQHLYIANNPNLSGAISQFPRNGSFRSIVLSDTNFSGPVPHSIVNLSMLSRIELTNCNFTGAIPSAVGSLTELMYLDFSFNSFIGPIPLFNMSKKLIYLDLSRNGLTGLLSPKHFEGLSNLVFMNIGNNALNGTIPGSLFHLPSLQKLDVSNNKFTGQVSFSTRNSSNLDTLDMSSNKLEGSIPEALFNLENLRVLSLYYNSFNGTVHLEKIQNLPSLKRLDLGYNKFSVDAYISNSSLTQFPQLSRLNLASCNLNHYPDLLRNQSRLTYLDLSNNNITGEIPSWIWGIGHRGIIHLNLSFNQLVDLQKPFDLPPLSVLDLHSNRLHGKFPIPPESIIYVDYSNNSFQQPIPWDIGINIAFASFISAANNKLSGTIPPSLCNATYLQVLDLSGNKLSGSLPPCLVKNTKSLGVLNLGGNRIHGDIPDTFPVSCGLKTLDLSRNDLGGKIPASLANCRSLEVVNVGNNKIHGGFPCMLKNLSTLRVLVLRNNRFHGELECSGVNEIWSNLQIIDLASNNFSGNISERALLSWSGMALLRTDGKMSSNHLHFSFLGLNNFYYTDTVKVTAKGLELELVKILTIFTSIDFSCNNFQGPIPNTIGDLGALYVLNLSHNNLNGPIPKSIGNLMQLGSLDLSQNQLTGEIPEELRKLTFLSFLNLSNNNLVGVIPSGPQLQTFSSSSYVGNTGLCGFPLAAICNPNESEGKSAPNLMTDQEFDWTLVFASLGYGVGVAVVISLLLLCKQLRQQWNYQLDRLFLKLFTPR